MGWTRRWRIETTTKLYTVLRALQQVVVNPAAPMELILRTEREEKTDAQRRLFHAVCADIAPLAGMTPGQVKLRVKGSFYGVEIKGEDGVYYAVVPSSEDSDREEYSRLIDHAYQWAAQGGHYVPDRRPK